MLKNFQVTLKDEILGLFKYNSLAYSLQEAIKDAYSVASMLGEDTSVYFVEKV